MLKKIILGILACLISVSASAGVGSDLENFFDSIGMANNVSDGGAYSGQRAGYYTGGSLYARAPARSYQLTSFQVPHARGGCGGIDLYGGSFSFINSDQLVAMARNVGQNALGFAFNLALSTLCPKCEELTSKMQSWANYVNSMNINSCETASGLVGGIWPQTAENQKQLCQAIGTERGIFTDWAAARQGCSAAGQQSSTLAAGKSDPRYRELIFDSGNVAWKALKKNTWTASDTELAELIMNLTGTVIINKATNTDDTPPSPTIVPPNLSPNIINSLMTGGSVTILGCNNGTGENQCTTLRNKTISVPKGFVDRVTAILSNIYNAIVDDTPLSPTGVEVGLLNSTSLPVYKLLNVWASYNPSGALNTIVSTYSDMIAMDVLFQYLDTIAQAAKESTNRLAIPQELSKSYLDQIDELRSLIAGRRENFIHQTDRTIQMVQETMVIERTLISRFSPGLAGSYNWARALQ